MPERATPERFSAWLHGMGWSGAEAARHLETNRATIFRWEREQGVPAYVWKLCKTLEATHGPAEAKTTRARAGPGHEAAWRGRTPTTPSCWRPTVAVV
jgi:DNA-binding XRE family transcriptional regulator